MTDSRWLQLARLREFSRSTGALHEGQVLQLRTWPHVVLPHLKTNEAKVLTWFECANGHEPQVEHLTRDAEGVAWCEQCPSVLSQKKAVCFRFEFKVGKKPPADIQKRIKVLDENVREMLGQEWIVQVVVKSKTKERVIFTTDGRTQDIRQTA